MQENFRTLVIQAFYRHQLLQFVAQTGTVLVTGQICIRGRDHQMKATKMMKIFPRHVHQNQADHVRKVHRHLQSRCPLRQAAKVTRHRQVAHPPKCTLNYQHTVHHAIPLSYQISFLTTQFSDRRSMTRLIRSKNSTRI